MTINEINKIKKKLCEIHKLPEQERRDSLIKLCNETGVISGKEDSTIDEIVCNIHTTLQTEMMLNACLTAKRASIWASAAVTIALIGTVAAWLTVYISILFKVF